MWLKRLTLGGDPDSRNLPEFLVEREHQAVGALVGDTCDCRICKTQACFSLVREDLKCV